MTSSKPYLIRAIYEWILDNNLTPYIAVDTSVTGIVVPTKYIEDERIILDISPLAANNLIISNDGLKFKARFNGISHKLYIPISAVMVIYAQENNRGMAFPPEEYHTESSKEDSQTITTTPTKDKPQLKLVTGGKNLDTSKKK
jgi:stringent starvation protein B